ncbi:hypothetical protein L4D06_13600 [Enterovibrio makurazakiensis]|uniref:hypothetical protein n=1 Tax=Enterovibrio makurazakiensis TaxID=2910232 RepID=UPI003D1C8DB5
MLLLLRKVLLPLCLAVLLGWQGFVFAEHQASHQHTFQSDNHCALCAIGLPFTTTDNAVIAVVKAAGYASFDIPCYLPQTLALTPKARAPPPVSPTLI